MIESSFEIAENTLNMIIAGKRRIMHEKTSLLDSIR
jgi:hypothetical protein